MVEIVDSQLETSSILSEAQSDLSGAVVLFLGTTRQYTGDLETTELEYECYREMAMKKMRQLREIAIHKWKLHGCAMVHRTGVVPIGQASVAIAVSSGHRKAAFEAAQWLIDTLKREVPIWKKECYSDGTTEWIHPQ
jgi:molybdopterin synthase catalytic subunit